MWLRIRLGLRLRGRFTGQRTWVLSLLDFCDVVQHLRIDSCLTKGLDVFGTLEERPNHLSPGLWILDSEEVFVNANVRFGK